MAMAHAHSPSKAHSLIPRTPQPTRYPLAELQKVVDMLTAEQEAKELKLSAATEAMAEAHARLDAATADSAELETALKSVNDELTKTNEVVEDLRERAEASDSLRQAAAKSDAYKAEMDRLREKLGSLGHIEEELKVMVEG